MDVTDTPIDPVLLTTAVARVIAAIGVFSVQGAQAEEAQQPNGDAPEVSHQASPLC
jgi:hypothetical protein